MHDYDVLGVPEPTAEFPMTRVMEIATFIRNDVEGLNGLARAMSRLGLRDSAEEIYATIQRVEVMCKMINDNVSDAISGNLRASQEATGNMMMALVGGIRIGSKDPMDEDSLDTLEDVFKPRTRKGKASS